LAKFFLLEFFRENYHFQIEMIGNNIFDYVHCYDRSAFEMVRGVIKWTLL
jgi:hypothetical protein